MENPKVYAYLYSNERDGTEMKQQEVELIDSKTEDGRTTYIVKTGAGIYCTAIYNFFTSAYYADDVYGVIEKNDMRRIADMEM